MGVKVSGGCHCGNIRYDAEIDPARIGICHCTDCQKLTGTAYRVSVRTPAAQVRFTGGEPNFYVKVAHSGARRAHAFCPNCGAPIYATNEDDRSFLTLRVGGIDQRQELMPVRQAWCGSALPWAQDLTDIPGIERQ